MSAKVELASFLDSDPDHRGGRPFIRGRRVSVDRISIMYKQGYSAEEIAADHSLSLAQVYTALAFYLANREAIDREQDEIDAEERRLEEEFYAERNGHR